ncbi:TPA: hypothetical protein JD854_RS12755 [Citrobacter amalonaticus]|uniref:Uncharacterized protein n=1 Tax=Citrobacter amalonaticus TaxID=35703 RepID=A0A9C7QKZ3_CITAM|nr:hypothetical protein [Citrobacter amalonaticus]
MAQARIENTIIASYDLASEKSTHYQLQIHTQEKQTTFTLAPLGTQDNSPSIFKVFICLKQQYGSAQYGEFRVSAVNTNKNDLRMTNLGYFVSEQNLETWWLHLNENELLMFNPEVGGLLVTDPITLNHHIDKCAKN